MSTKYSAAEQYYALNEEPVENAMCKRERDKY